MALYLDISRYRCPRCWETVAVNRIQDFSTRFGKREAFDCPHCGTRLNWARNSHRLAHFSLWLAVLTFPLPLLGVYSTKIGIWVLGGFLLASAAGMMLKHLVVEDR